MSVNESELTLDDVFHLLDGDDQLCWILVGDNLSESYPNFIEAACLAVTFANDYPVEAAYPADVEVNAVAEETAEQRRQKVNAIRSLVHRLRAQNDLTFSLLWQVRKAGIEPQLAYSGNLTARQAWQSIIRFLQHDIAWAIGGLVG